MALRIGLTEHGDLTQTKITFIAQLVVRIFLSINFISLFCLRVILGLEQALCLIELIPPGRIHSIGVFYLHSSSPKAAATGKAGQKGKNKKKAQKFFHNFTLIRFV
jgi:hypothetical protein